MIEAGKNNTCRQPGGRFNPLVLLIPVKATGRTAEGVKEYDGRLVALGEGHAQVCFDHPLAPGAEVAMVVDFKDRQNREIRFKYDAKVTSPHCTAWYEVSVDLGEGVGISGKDARMILSELSPEEG